MTGWKAFCSRHFDLWSPPVRSRSVILLALFVFILGCSTSGELFAPLGGGGAAGGGTVPPGQQLFGQVLIEPIFPITDPQVRQAALEVRELLEQQGLFVAPNGEFVAWPRTPGSGWLVQVAGQQWVAGPDGTFGLQAPQSGEQGGTLAHPSDGQLPPVAFSLAQLSTSQAQPGRLVVPMFFGGGCGMTEGDTCGADVEARYVAPEWTGEGDPADVPFFWGVQRTGFGTYPPPEEWLRVVAGRTCPQFDGFFADGSTAASNRNYFGSTCDLNVLEGTCPNENPLSDIEYQAFLNTVGFDEIVGSFGPTMVGYYHSVRGTADPEDYLTPPELAGKINTSCILNHKGRMCGMFSRGDVAVRAGLVARPGQPVTLEVPEGLKGSITVHNNGVFGFTEVTTTSEEPVVTLDLQPGEVVGGVPRLLHYDEDFGSGTKKKHIYHADRIVEFQVSEDADPGDTVTYFFTVDDRTAEVTFEVVEQEIAIFPEMTELEPGGMQTFSAVVQNPGSGTLLYRWSLGFGTGALSSTDQASTTYTAPSPVAGPVSDILNLDVTIERPDGTQDILGSASAEIRVISRELQITPPSAVVRPKESETFTVTVSGAPAGSTLVYQWEVLNGQGSLSVTDQATTTYTARSDVIPPQMDVVRLTVFTQGAGGLTEFASQDVPVSIEAFFPISDTAFANTPSAALTGDHRLLATWTGGPASTSRTVRFAAVEFSGFEGSAEVNPGASVTVNTTPFAGGSSLGVLPDGSGAIGWFEIEQSGNNFLIGQPFLTVLNASGTLGGSAQAGIDFLIRGLAGAASEVIALTSTMVDTQEHDFLARPVGNGPSLSGPLAPALTYRLFASRFDGVGASDSHFAFATTATDEMSVKNQVLGGVVALSGGTAVPLVIDDDTGGTAAQPGVGLLPDGRGAISWSDNGDLRVRTLQEDGTLGPVISVTDDGFVPNPLDRWDAGSDVVRDPVSGDIIVVWSRTEAGNGNLYLQRFTAAGAAVHARYQVRAGSDDTESNPILLVDGAGNFAVVWRAVPAGGGASGIFGHLFPASFSP